MDALSGEATGFSKGCRWPFPSKSERDRIAHVCSAGWRVRLQRRRVHDKKMLMDIDVAVPEQQIFNMLQQSLASKTPHRFAVPVCFSSDLNRLVILDSILSTRNVSPEESSASVTQCRLQCLGRNFFIQNQRQDSTLTIKFAPNASAFAFVSASRNPGKINYKKIQVWSNVAADDDWPRFEYKGEVLATGMRPDGVISRELFAFHPLLPLLAYCEWRSIMIWKYNESMYQFNILRYETLIYPAAFHPILIEGK